MDIRAERIRDALVLTPLFGRLDAAAAPAFRERALASIQGQRLVVLDLARLTFIDSSGLGALVALLKGLPAGGKLRLASAGERVRALLRLTRLESIFPVFESVEDALRA